MSLATACHPASRNPAARLEPKSQCVHSVASFTFFPLLAKKKKKSGYKSQASLPPPKQPQDRGRAEPKAAGLAPGVGRQACWSYTSSSSSAFGREATGLQQQHWRRIVLSLQEEGKPRTNLTWFPPQGDCSPIQGCHSHATH